MAAIGLAVLIWAIRRKPRASIVTPARPRRPSPLLIFAFVFLCLYPLGIPTSWTRVNIEKIRGEEPAANP